MDRQAAVTAGSLTTLPADLRKLIDDTENSMAMLYRSVDEYDPRKPSKSRKQHSRVPQKARPRTSKSAAVYSTDSDWSQEGSVDDDDDQEEAEEQERRHRSRRHTHDYRKERRPQRATRRVPSRESDVTTSLSHSTDRSGSDEDARPGKGRRDGQQRTTARATELPRSSARGRAYRHVTYNDDDDAGPPASTSDKHSHTSSQHTAAAGDDLPPSLTHTRRPAHASAGVPASAASTAGLCQSTLPANNTTATNESVSVVNRSAVPTESTPTKMLTEFGHRWDARYRQMLGNVVVDSSFERTVTVSGPASPARVHEGSAVMRTAPAPRHDDMDVRTPAQPPQPQPQPQPVAASLELTTVVAQRDALQESLRAKERELVECERAHLQQITALRDDVANARREGAREAQEHLATSASLKESILQAALEAERQRTAEMSDRATEAEKALRDVRRRADEHEINLTLQERTQALRAQELQATRQRQDVLESQLARAADERRELEEALRISRVEAEAREAQRQAAQRDLESLEGRVAEQEEAARATLKQLEGEFEEATSRYQELLDEATRRVEHLEKVQRKYKSLKDAHQRVTDSAEETTTSLRRQLNERDELVEALQKELKAVQAESVKQQELMRAKDDANEEKLRSAQRQLELKGASSSEQVKTLQQHLETANHTIELLRTQVDGLKEEVREEQIQTQQASMRMAELELHLKEELVEQQRDGSVAKTRHAEAIAALKQQLKEKNSKLEALAASSMEPLQRLREQLENERGKRAHLEEQLSRFKKRAKDAEEASLRELRREQLRQSTEAAALLTATPHTARPSPVSSTGGGGGGGSVLSSAHRHTPITYSSVPSWAARGGGVGGGARTRTSSHGSRLGSANARSDAPSTVDDLFEPHQSLLTEDRPRLTSGPASQNREGSPPQVQTTAIVEYSPVRRRDGRGAGVSAEADVVSRPSLPPSLSEWQERRRQQQPPPPSRLPHAVRGDEGEERNALPPRDQVVAPPFRRVADQSALSSRSQRAETHAAPPAGAGASAAETANTSLTPPATVGSLSGISRSSPCNSTSRLDEDASAGLCEEGGGPDGAARASQPAQRSRTSSPHAAPPTAGHLVSPAQEEQAEETAANAVAAQHDQRMREFHASAAEVMRRISGGRDAFMSRCAEVIQRSSALGTQAVYGAEQDDTNDKMQS